MVLTGGAAVISIEPEPDNSTTPFTLKPLMDMDIEDVGAGTLQTMANRAAMNPTGRVDLRLPRAYGVRIDMPTTAHTGEPFWVVGLLDNPDTPRMDVPTFFVLGVQGEYWFWPSWGQYDPMVPGSVDYRMMDVPTGTTSEWVINLFTWPDIGSETVTGLQMIGAFLNSSMTDIEGEWALVEWGFGP